MRLTGALFSASSSTPNGSARALAIMLTMCLVTVVIPGCPDPDCEINSPPVADAGADAVAEVGEEVVLDGSASSDLNGDTLSFEWEQQRGPLEVALSTLTGSATSFVPTVAGVYEFRLFVSDGCEGIFSRGSRDSVVVEVVGEESCGDGVCSTSETTETCPTDCGDGRPFCGDSICDADETASLCPSDCGTPNENAIHWVSHDDPYWPGMHPVTFEFGDAGSLEVATTTPSTDTVEAILEFAGLPGGSYTIEETRFAGGIIRPGEVAELLTFTFHTSIFGSVSVRVSIAVDRFVLSFDGDNQATLSFNTQLLASFAGERWTSLGHPSEMSIRIVGRRDGLQTDSRMIEWTRAAGEVLSNTGEGVLSSPLSERFVDADGAPLALGVWTASVAE